MIHYWKSNNHQAITSTKKFEKHQRVEITELYPETVYTYIVKAIYISSNKYINTKEEKIKTGVLKFQLKLIPTAFNISVIITSQENDLNGLKFDASIKKSGSSTISWLKDKNFSFTIDKLETATGYTVCAQLIPSKGEIVCVETKTECNKVSPPTSGLSQVDWNKHKLKFDPFREAWIQLEKSAIDQPISSSLTYFLRSENLILKNVWSFENFILLIVMRLLNYYSIIVT